MENSPVERDIQSEDNVSDTVDSQGASSMEHTATTTAGQTEKEGGMESESTDAIAVTKAAELEGGSDSASTETGECSKASGSGATSTGAPMEQAVDRFLQKQRNEIMFELRRLQHGDRPVTGQGNREVVSQFLDQVVGTSSDTPAPAPEQRRPESVVVEVNALVERRPVSNVLQSAQFRRSLETALRGALNVRSPLPRSARGPASASSAQLGEGIERHTPRTARGSPSASSARPADGIERHTTRTARPVRVTSRDSVSVASSTSYHTTEENILPGNIRSDSDNIPRAPTPEVLSQPAQPIIRDIWQQPQVNAEEVSERAVWENLDEERHHQVIQDISELVQRQLVTSALDGAFRPALESNLRNRVVNIASDGQQVADFVRSLPQSQPILRNDFSDLGILGPQQQAALSDEVSVISATAAVTVPYEQSAPALRAEMRSMRSQLHELQRLMRLSIDMQMDVQRSIRQEVAASLAQAGVPATGVPSSPRPVNDEHCLICLDASTDTVIYQCGHMCVCYTCGLQLRQQGAHCPVCRAPIRDIMRVYRCNKA